MPKCKNEALLNMITQKQLTRNTVISFNILDELPDCKKIMANAYVDIANNSGFNAHKRPVNRFECDAFGCLSGTQYIAEEGSVTYKAQYDATEFANGAITFYVAPTEDGTVKVTIGDKADLADADTYEVEIKASDAKEDGFVPVFVDLTSAPASTSGEGWSATKSGAYIKIESDKAIGLSSISIFDDINDFAVNDVVQMACLSGFDGTSDLTALETECMGSGYDTTDNSPIELTVTGRMLTPNYWKLNARGAKGEKTDGFTQTTITATVSANEDGNYGIVTIADKADNCGWLKAQVADSCNVTDSELEYLSIPSLVDMDSAHFLALPGEDGATDLYFNKDLIGQEILITYPQAVKVQNHQVYSMDNVGYRRVRATIEVESSDDVKSVMVFPNVLLTSFPLGLTNEETEFSFTLSIQRDANGVEYERYDIVA